jgi:hypothetical protein
VVRRLRAHQQCRERKQCVRGIFQHAIVGECVPSDHQMSVRVMLLSMRPRAASEALASRYQRRHGPC